MSSVKVIGITNAIIDDVVMDAQALVAYCARASNPTNQLNHGTAGKLLRYLVNHQHWSPFEMAHVVMEIITTRDIARQILRHRSFSFQEFSQRYAVVADEPVFRGTRLQDLKNRQSSLTTDDEALDAWWLETQAQVAAATRLAYQAALEKGIAKEVARTVLPEGMTPSRLYMAGSLRSWIHYIQLRTGNGTQLEHREVALQCRAALLDEAPALADLFNYFPSDEKEHEG